MKGILGIAAVLSFFLLLGQTAMPTPPAYVITKFTRLQFQGTAQSPEVYSTSYPVMSLSASGSGIANQLGEITLIYRGEIDLTDFSTVESAQFLAKNGDSIEVTGVGQATETATPGIFNVIQIYKVTGGTGRFTGARGTITLQRTMNMASGLTNSTFEGYLLLPYR